jgi:hypothetical protein
MIRKIKLLIAAGVTAGIVLFIYTAAQLTKLRDSDILDVEFDEEDF